MSKSILVINDEELQFLKNVTNQYRQSNLKPEYYSVVEKIRSNDLQDTTELLEALDRIVDECPENEGDYIIITEALGG